jgi:hypothetical protein
VYGHIFALTGQRGADIGKITGFRQGRFDVLGCLDPRLSVGRGREFHEPVVVHINRANNVGFPSVGFGSIDTLF